MSLPIRYSPSGAVISNSDGGDLVPGSGMRLRLVEAMSTMGGSLAVPVSPAVISAAGFGNATAIVLTLDSPKAGLKYRAKLSLDLVNVTTNIDAQVVLYLDTSIDGGTTYTNRAKSAHLVKSGSTSQVAPVGNARNADVYLVLTTGEDLGIDDATPPASIKLRARANLPLGSAGDVLASSLYTSDGTAVDLLEGTIHMELEECY